MKKLIMGFLLCSGLSLFWACNENKSTTENSSVSSDSVTTGNTDTSDTTKTSGTKMDTMNNAGNQMVDQKTRDFVNDAATGGMMEVELGNLATQKAKSQRVKDFGRMMVDDHTNANNNLKEIASRKNIDVPAVITDDQKKDMDKLSKKSGADFDKAYVDMMVEDHKKDIAAFKKAAGTVSDNDIKNFATTTLPTLQKHLDSIQSIKSQK